VAGGVRPRLGEAAAGGAGPRLGDTAAGGAHLRSGLELARGRLATGSRGRRSWPMTRGSRGRRSPPAAMIGARPQPTGHWSPRPAELARDWGIPRPTEPACGQDWSSPAVGWPLEPETGGSRSWRSPLAAGIGARPWPASHRLPPSQSLSLSPGERLKKTLTCGSRTSVKREIGNEQG
jgi:hypothetical protein